MKRFNETHKALLVDTALALFLALLIVHILVRL